MIELKQTDKIATLLDEIKQQEKKIKYNSISIDTDQMGALNDHPLSNPHFDAKPTFRKK